MFTGFCDAANRAGAADEGRVEGLDGGGATAELKPSGRRSDKVVGCTARRAGVATFLADARRVVVYNGINIDVRIIDACVN